ncbi:MAG: hypothetical protein UV07_C0028G0006 [Candidatus Azambacteria bacterium GW2011_GWB1_42_17]|uniref:DUF6922 domain-containing protein n=1 Tax=Candidatus Azambacteria bacterium GW2011_GWB1_42_17 TaxID=1618615 RepID=A0A0G1C1Z5_9BACT|nr:MAG: hypothetical protein UV07_C0028G0006 [Candidatus Azambacteria bacterium GW2011_GWB1_42_17]KKS87273.1 MAG: hypothetical protein UV62_C0031G0006 [Parcubacteria group bacterium GW2011_GWC1_43_11]
MSAKLPLDLKRYFWDVDFKDLDLRTDAYFILKRIIDRGNTPALKWALSQYSADQIKELVLNSRDLSRKTANFWTKLFALDPKQVPCLVKPYSRIPFGVSPN